MRAADGKKRDAFEVLAEDYFAACRRGAPPSLEQLADAHPDLRERIFELLPTLALLEGAGEVERRADEPVRTIGAYRLGAVLGRGGMGVVYEARHEALDRTVALKVISGGSAPAPGQVERFQREVHAAARLRHPNIVPVFDVGEVDGVAYYTMPRIEGASVDDVLRELRRLRNSASDTQEESADRAGAATVLARRLLDERRGAASSGSDSSDTKRAYFRGAARLVLDATRALEYAHGEGVLHRDLKPSNLLLDGDGRVWIADFGLARSEGTEDLTGTGDVLGTPRYIAPESLRGWSDPRTDVYGLGITLYELLTLRPAFPGGDRIDLLRRVAEEPPARPSRLERQLPRDLETIVLKAVEKDPERRYPTAGALADDLQRFLSAEPILARPSTALHRSILFARRHRAGVLATALVLLVTIGLVTAWLISLDAARERERVARLSAEANLRLARGAVEQIQMRLALELLPFEPRQLELHRHVLEDAVAFYREFLTRSAPDAALVREAADAWRALGKLQFVQHEFAPARESLAEAERLLRGQLEASPDDHQAGVSLVCVRLHQGRLFEALADVRGADRVFDEALRRAQALRPGPPGASLQASLPLLEACATVGQHMADTCRPREAEELLGHGLERATELLRAHPEDAHLMRHMQSCLQTRSDLLRDSGRMEAGRADLETAFTLVQRLVARPMPNPEDRLSSAAIEFRRGAFGRATGDLGGAARAFARAAAILDVLIADHPGAASFRTLRAEVRMFHAVVELEEGRATGALDELRASLDELETLLPTHSLALVRRAELATGWILIGNGERYRGATSEAEEAYRRALEVLEQLRAQTPHFEEVERFVSLAAMASGNLGSQLVLTVRDVDAPEFEEGLQRLRESAARYALMQERDPDAVEYVERALGTRIDLAYGLRRSERWDEARRVLEETVAFAEQVQERFPERDEVLARVANAAGELGMQLRAQGHLEAAREQLERSIELTEARLAAGAPGAVDSLASKLNNLAMVRLDQGRWPEAHELAARAIELRLELLARRPEDARSQTFLKYHRIVLARADLGLGRFDRAASVVSELVVGDAAGEPYVYVARVLAQASAGLSADDARRDDATALADQALELLERGIEHGDPEARAMASDTAFASLRDRPEFAALLARVAGSAR